MARSVRPQAPAGSAAGSASGAAVVLTPARGPSAARRGSSPSLEDDDQEDDDDDQRSDADVHGHLIPGGGAFERRATPGPRVSPPRGPRGGSPCGPRHATRRTSARAASPPLDAVAEVEERHVV